jgi:tetratricopeptide (TPR) repeat protein
MRKLVLFILICLFVGSVSSQIIDPNQNKAQLASSYYRSSEFSKAAPLYLELYESTNMPYYFDNYVNCLIGDKNYDEAEKAIRKQLRKAKNVNLQITLGFVYKEKGDVVKATSTYDEVINEIDRNVGSIVSVASTFFNRREFEYAEKAYMRGRQILPGEMFRSNLATIYAYTRNYSRMMEEYLFLIKENETQLNVVEGRLNSLLRYDFDNSLRNLVKREVLKKMNEEPQVTAYNRLLIWVFVQEQNYDQALSQAIALDKRTKTEETSVFDFSKSAAQNNLFDVALTGYQYLMAREPRVKNPGDVRKEIVSSEYKKYIQTPFEQRPPSEKLVSKFDNLLSELGFYGMHSQFILDYAHFLAFYLGKTAKAMEILEKTIALSDLTNIQRSLLKLELADINVFDDNLWGATLIYAQIIDANKDNTIGDEAKLKKARLGFYLGDIMWAKAQLDVLKASTSKLTANDAMELSLLISAYYELDTLDLPIQMFGKGDLLIFQNRDGEAVKTYDSIVSMFPGHALADKILMRKAEIKEKNFDFEGAVSLYRKLLADYAFSSSADDAMYKMAVITEEKLGKLEDAQELYKLFLISYPASIYTVDSRKRYRTLRGDKLEPEDVQLEMNFDGPLSF